MRRTIVTLGVWLAVAAAAFADGPPDRKEKGPMNRLAKETSPYLLQHAHNPVDWYPWGPEAFAKAKAEGKPIFLSVGYSSCYWCHVMERETFEDEATAKALNKDFVCIKVDREERPDVDAVYMAALRAFSGSGGWPMSMFLFPDGRPFFGGTYFPARQKNNVPGFDRLLVAVQDAWEKHRGDLDTDATNLTEAARRIVAADAKARAPLSRSMGLEGVAALAEQFDPEHGGFGFDPARPRSPKFPEPANLVLLLDRARRKAEAPRGVDPPAMLATTLDRMARGGIRDHLAGGYHRYAVDRAWAVPHFEKMLYDNAQLASTYLEAFAQTGEPRWRREAEDIFTFVARSMTSPEGAFFSALDAEVEAEEGKSYVWTRGEVRTILGDADADLFAKVYGLDLDPNFEEGRYVLLLPRPFDAIAKDLGLSPDVLESRLVPLRAKLLAARDARPQPFLDDKILTSWNGLMIGAYADAARILEDERYRKAADTAADFLLTTHRSEDGRLLRTSRAGKAKGAGYLEDYAFLAQGLLRLHDATGDPARLDQAKRLTDRMLADFTDAENGGFFSTASDGEVLIARPKDAFDNAIPGGNSVAIRNLVELAKKTGNDGYLDAAGKALEGFSALLKRAPSGAPLMLSALDDYLDARPGAAKANPLDALKPAAAPIGEVLKVRASGPASAKVGEEFAVTLAIDLADGWHIAANPSGSDALKPTVVELAADAPATLVGVTYPAGLAKALAAFGDIKPLIYEGTLKIPVRVRLDAKAAPGDRTILLRLRYQACDDRRCLVPAVAEVQLKIAVAP